MTTLFLFCPEPGKVEQLTVYKVGRRIIGLRWGLPKETYGDIKSFTISYRSEHQQVKSFTVTPAPCIAWPGLYCHTISSLHADREYTVTVSTNVSILTAHLLKRIEATGACICLM